MYMELLISIYRASEKSVYVYRILSCGLGACINPHCSKPPVQTEHRQSLLAEHTENQRS